MREMEIAVNAVSDSENNAERISKKEEITIKLKSAGPIFKIWRKNCRSDQKNKYLNNVCKSKFIVTSSYCLNKILNAILNIDHAFKKINLYLSTDYCS
jgi:hypothetical protein